MNAVEVTTMPTDTIDLSAYGITEAEKARIQDDAAYRVDLIQMIGPRETVAWIIRQALAIRRMEELGENVEELKTPMGVTLPSGWLALLRRLAEGRVYPEIILGFWAVDKNIARRVATYPLHEQKKIVENQSIAVVVRSEAGRYVHRLMEPASMTRDQRNQVFGYDGLYDEKKQIAFLEDRRMKEKSADNGDKPERADVVLKTRGPKGISVRGFFISRALLMTYLQQLGVD